ncbi:MAG: PQQ-binding-like beta-propeller repeat protein [Leptospirales bacterium]
MRKILLFIIILACSASAQYTKNWPVYKGNLYFTGNNDEIIVKNSDIKWIFLAPDRIFNPVISEGKIYFIDIKKNLYCVDEETGALLWRIDIKVFASRFASYGKVSGKIKYPLIYGDNLLITDSIAIYCFNKNTGKVIWARTGLVTDNYKQRGKNAMVEGIYADPFIYNDRIYYGTRNFFYSRSLKNGELIWENSEISSYSAFGTFYGNYIFTQSRDYSNNKYYLFCIDLNTGKTLWKREIELPFKIFPPVVHGDKVIIPSAKTLYAFDLKTGDPLYSKDLKEYITSPPAFTDKYIRITLSNRKLVTLEAETGKIVDETNFPEQSGPKFVTIRDQIYVAYAKRKTDPETGKAATYTVVEAHSLDNKEKIWTFEPTNKGTPSEPIAENGVLFVPVGNRLYALGEKGDGEIHDFEEIMKEHRENPGTDNPQNNQPVSPPMKEIELDIEKEGSSNDPVNIEITAKKDGKTIYKERIRLRPGQHKIEVPKDADVEITADSKGHLPEKISLGDDGAGETDEPGNNADDTAKTNTDKPKIKLRKIEEGKNYVMDNINFETSKAYLKKGSVTILDKIVKLMNDNPGLKLEVQGHTDSTGKRDFNMTLSHKRANAVIEYLIKNGVSPERLKAIGKGPDHPIDSNKTKSGRANNRRTEFVFY